MSFLSTLRARPPRLSRLSRYTVANGVLYLAIGLGLYALPEPLLERALGADLEGFDAGLAHALCFAVAVIGFFYVMGGRTGAASFGLATVVDRALVPLFLVPLWLGGQVAPAMVLPLVVLDPLLGLGAYLVWRSEPSPPASSDRADG